MSTIGSLKRHPQASTSRALADNQGEASASDAAGAPVEGAHIRSGRDFSVGAYQQLDMEARRTRAPYARAFCALQRITSTFLHRLLAAMLESRRKQSAVMLARYGGLLTADHQLERSCSEKFGGKAGASLTCVRSVTRLGQAGGRLTIHCSITDAPCEGDFAHLCDEWGCARKAGLSPISHENF